LTPSRSLREALVHFLSSACRLPSNVQRMKLMSALPLYGVPSMLAKTLCTVRRRRRAGSSASLAANETSSNWHQPYSSAQMNSRGASPFYPDKVPRVIACSGSIRATSPMLPVDPPSDCRQGRISSTALAEPSPRKMPSGLGTFPWKKSSRQVLPLYMESRPNSGARKLPSSSPQRPDGSGHSRDPGASSGPEFVRGGLAAFVNIVTTFPMNKLMFRQATEDLTLLAAARSMRKEGLRHLYRGLAPPLTQKMLSMSMMFGLFDLFLKQMKSFAIAENSPTGQTFLAAILAGSTEALLTPLERVQTVLQHRHFTHRYDNMLDATIKLRVYGLAEYYRGIVPILLRNGPANAIYFLSRERVKESIPVPVDSNGHPIHSWEIGRNFGIGALLGATISTVFFPLNVVKSVMQSQVGGPHIGVMSCFKSVYAERGGVHGLFRGVNINFTRSIVSWGIINSVYELLQNVHFGESGIENLNRKY